jgi:hypothetical protein
MARKKKIVEPIILEGLTEETTDQTLETSGLGDVISNITSALGIEECEPCARRKAALNKAFPWLKASREITEEEVQFIKKITSTHTLQNDDVNNLFKLYNDIFSSKLSRCNCPGLISKMIQRLGVLVIE